MQSMDDVASDEEMSEIPFPLVEPATAARIEQAFLTCPICYEVYDQPKSLPCLHTFCAHCLLSFIESKDLFGIRRNMGFPCPVCKHEVSIRNYHKPYKSWLEEIPHNFLVQSMVNCLVPEKSRHGLETKINADDNEKVLWSTNAEKHLTAPGSTIPLSMSWQPVAPFCIPDAASTEEQPQYIQNNPRHDASELASSEDTSETGNFSDQNRSADSINDLMTSDPIVFFSHSSRMQRTYQMTARNWNDYKPPRLSDVCCLPKHNSIIVLDFDNRCVKYIKNVFLGRNVTTSMEVVGRPFCVALLDKHTEDRIVVSILNRQKLYFIRVPDMELIDVMDTRRAYRSLTVLSPTAILAGSVGKAARLDLIQIDHRCKMVSCNTIYQNEYWNGTWNGDLYSPQYMTAVSPSSFAVSDVKKKNLLYFTIEGDNRTSKASKRFRLRRFREAGGLCYHDGSVYLVDTATHEVHRVILNRSAVYCETLLTQDDGIYKPASVCVGPKGEVCVVNWEGVVYIFKTRP